MRKPTKKPLKNHSLKNTEIMETIMYRGHEIEITQFENAENPFKNWDGEPGIIVETFRNRNENHLSEGEQEIRSEISDIILAAITQAPDNGKEAIKTKIEEITGYEQWEEYTEDFISEAVKDSDIETLSNLCDYFKITYFSGISKGYSQGDWAAVFLYYTKEKIEEIGIQAEHIQQALESSFKLFGYWMWGDVYEYYIPSVGSCLGYYGSNHEESGLLEQAESAIDYYEEKKLKDKFKLLKTKIKARTPLMYR